ncbi:hypothetical protein BSSX_1942 [Bacillus subtilis]|nr:hypothetical protein BSSX_1942 [Bacillus subtilis]
MDIFKERERIPGSYLDYSAADRVEGDQLEEITKKSRLRRCVDKRYLWI